MKKFFINILCGFIPSSEKRKKLRAKLTGEDKNLIQEIIEENVLKFYGQFEIPVDKFIFERYFPDKNIQGVFIESGAFDGLQECSCKFFEETMDWTGYNIEPVPAIFEKLVENRPNSNNFNIALSDKTGETSFTCVIHPELKEIFGNSSIQHTESHMEVIKRVNCELKEIKIQALTYKDFIEQNKITHVDLFVLDVEGYELSVIEGMKNCKILPDIFCIEFGHIGFDKIRKVMEELGYFYDITSFANAFFIKKEMAPLFSFRTTKGYK